MATAGGASAATVVNYTDFTSVAGLTLTGSASQVGNLVRLTPALDGQVGRAFAETQLGTASSFSTDFVIKLHDTTNGPADGIAFVLQPVGDNAAGGEGGGIGYLNYPTSVGVEFDTFQNTENGDPDANHVEVTSTSNGTHSTLGRAAPGFSLYGNLDVHGWVDYDALGHRIQVFASQSATKPGAPLIDVPLDLTSVVGPSTFVGFTASTGAQNSVHDLLSWHLTGQVDDPCTAPGAIRGTAANNVLKGTAGDDVICGLGGKDTITGGGGDDQIYGGDGNDNLDGGLGADRIVGGTGTDVVTYAGRAESITVDLDDVLATDGAAGESDDIRIDVENLVGGNGTDVLRGSTARNVLDGGPGADVLEGRDGVDTASYATRTAAQPVTISDDGAAGSGGALDGAGDTVMEDVENLTGGAGDDTLLGNGGTNVLDGGRGADVMDGDAGIDTVTYAGRTSPLVVRINALPVSGDTSDVSGGRSDQITTSVERVIGGSADDLLVGSASNNTLTGGPGADRLIGRNGNDTLMANDGSVDLELDCDGGATPGTLDVVYLDAGDPAAPNCETTH